MFRSLRMLAGRRLMVVSPSASPYRVARRTCCTAGCSSTGMSIAELPKYAVSSASEVVRLRGRAENKRIGKRVSFLHLRQPPFDSVQVVTASNAAAETLKDTVTPESIVDVYGTIVKVNKPVRSTSCMDYEIHATRIDVLSVADTPLPFPLRDTETKLDTRLDHRVVDMRTPLTAAMVRLVSAAGQAFREVLSSDGFLEIHTPKLLGAASEGGSAVFTVDYFEQKGYLAQSPQLYKQMVLMGDAMRVFEVGPVFRAEKSLTHRHLTEFVGLDAELVVHDSYTEVLDVLERTMCHLIYTLQSKHTDLMKVVAEQMIAQAGKQEASTPPEPIVAELSTDTVQKYNIRCDSSSSSSSAAPHTSSSEKYDARIGGTGAEGQPRVLRLAFKNAVQILIDHSIITEPVDDFSVVHERALGKIIKERYGVDVYIVDLFPVSARPFYTLPHPTQSAVTCSFDMYLRGEEICSGAQRQHDVAALRKRVADLGIDATPLESYISAFRYGAWPHGGFGLGLERIVLFLTGAQDIRQVSLFPRDPKRIFP